MRYYLGLALIGLAACSPQSPVSTTAETGKVTYPVGDELGAVNNLSVESALSAAKLVKTGQVYSLGTVTSSDTPKYPGRNFTLEVLPFPEGGLLKMGGNDDVLRGNLGIGTQLDGFGHISKDGKHYGGASVTEVFDPNGLKKFGTDTIPPIVTRGLLLDMAALVNKEQLEAGDVFNRAEIEAALDRQNLTLKRGDVVLFHTGWLKMAAQDPRKFISTQPGLGKEGATYLAEAGVVAIGADTAALETLPAETPEEGFPVHGILLVDHGVYILETINTHDLARDEAYEFLFVLGQPRIKGSVQAIINPVAVR